MIQKLARLLAPAETEGGGTAVADTPPGAMSSWITGLGSLETSDPPPAQTQKEDPNATSGTAPKPSGNNDAAASAQPSAAAAPAAPAPATPPGPADKQPAETPPAAPAKPAEAAKPEAAAGEPEKMPRNSKDWDAHKAAEAKRREKLQAEIQTSQSKIKELETQIKTITEAKSEEPSPSQKAYVEKLKAENEQMIQEMRMIETERIPRFREHYENEVNKHIATAKRIVGPEKAAELEKLLRLPDVPEYADVKQARIAEFTQEIDEIPKIRLLGIMNDLEKVVEERQEAIKNDRELAQQAQAQKKTQQAAQQAQLKASMEKIFNDVGKLLQDDKVGMAVYQKREGDNTWNDAVEKRMALAKDMIFGNKLKPDDIARAALHAAALPAVLEAYQADRGEWEGKIATLEAQVKQLTAAQPGKGTSTTGPSGGGERSERNIGQTPQEALSAWMKSIKMED